MTKSLSVMAVHIFRASPAYLLSLVDALRLAENNAGVSSLANSERSSDVNFLFVESVSVADAFD